ncbi:uncharacterized protein LOC133823531 [Humulus lupulus]|uniref:uncharacterized protein LOC133823531 n=1 Tax=Humulus lupulus TaxID=3486 RepID=UPI002B410885|nr:uncharacterized protein LOC133823531 [Humulus lupulus]
MAYGFEPVYERFRKQAPPSFKRKTDPMVGEDRLKFVEAIFDHMELNDHQRVLCATNLLKMDARIRWDVVKQTRDLNTMTWADFVQAFSKKYYNAAILDTRVDEFVTLVKGNLYVTDYAQKYDRLESFSLKILPTEAMQVQRFMRILKRKNARYFKRNSAEVVS